MFSQMIGLFCFILGLVHVNANSCSNCPAGWKFGGSKCYCISDARNWDGAKDFCEKLDQVTLGNGRQYKPSMLFVESHADYLQLIALTTNSGVAWQNCREEGGENQFVCKVDAAGKTTSYRNWDGGEPDRPRDNCVSIKLSNGKSHNAYCPHLKKTICEVPSI